MASLRQEPGFTRIVHPDNAEPPRALLWTLQSCIGRTYKP